MRRRFFKTPSGKALPGMIFMTERARCPDPVRVARTLPKGSGVILRDYRERERPELARALAAVCRERELFLLIGADWRLAAEVGAAGVHLPEWAPPSRPPGRLPKDFLVTRSAHSAASFPLAVAAGADAVLISPVFPTASHPAKPALGLHGFQRLLQRSPLPAYALGGLTVENVKRLPRHPKLAGVAGISLFFKS